MKKLLPLIFLCIANTLYAQLTLVPDDNFEAFLETNGMGNGITNDNFVTTSNIENITTLDISGNNIADLTGLENFTSLTELDCYENLLTTIDLTSLSLLERIDASENLILSVDLSLNPNLETLSINENFLTFVDVSQNPNLVNLYVDSNLITSIDISQNLLLEKISCAANRLINLNAKNGTNTNITTFVTSNNPDLTCIQVDNTAYSTTNWTNIDIISSFNENCGLVLSNSSFDLDNLSLFPNPTQNELYLNGDVNSIEIFSISGQKLMLINDVTYPIDLSQLESAMYLVKVSKGAYSKTIKIIKE